MRVFKVVVCQVAVALLATGVVMSQSRAPRPDRPVVYEGARLIIGDESAPIDGGAFVVQGGKITAIGRKGAIKVPGGATRVDLTGKTVMPALVNAHSHVGYEAYTHEGGESMAESFTADNILDHLQRHAFYGVGTVHDAGSASLPIAIQFLADRQAQKGPAAAQWSLMAGVVPPNGGADHVLRDATRPLRASYEVTRAPEAREAVKDIASKNVKHLKMWLGDRGGDYPAMPHEVYDAVIDEAHKAGIKVHAHATNNRDQLDAVRAGVDVIVHTVQNTKLSDELVAALKEKKPYWAPVMGLGDVPEACTPGEFIDQTMSKEILNLIRTGPRPGVKYHYPVIGTCRPRPQGTREATLKENFKTMIASGVRLVLSTDSGVFPSYTFGSSDHHEIGRYVEFGLTPAQAIVAATSRPAELLGLPDVGALAVGKKADFLVLTANPLDDIANTRKIDSVYLGGAKLDRAALLAKWQSPAAGSHD